MQYPNVSTAQPDVFGTGKPGYRDGHGFPAPEPTEIDAASMNALTGEIARAVELSGQTLDSGSYTQLFEAIRTAVSVFPVMASLALRATDSTHDFDALDDVCFVPLGGTLGLGVFVAVGIASSVVPGEAVWTSYDGIGWTKTPGSALGHLHSVATGNGLVVVAGHKTDGGSFRPVIGWAPINSLAFTESDITALPIADQANPVYSVVWAGSTHNRFVAAGDRSTPGLVLMYSNASATAWTLASPGSSYGGEFRKLLAVGSRVLAFGTLGEIQSSDDGGLTWTRRHSDPTLGMITSAVSVGGIILCNTSQQRTMLRSDDSGATWTEVSSPLTLELFGIDDAAIEHVGRFDRMLFAVCKDAFSGRRYIIGSLDGALTWSYVVRMPAIDSNGGATATLAASANDSCRLVVVGTIGTLGTAVAFASSSAAIGSLA